MPLHLTAVLDPAAHSPSGGLLDWAIRRNFMDASRCLLEATGTIDLFHFEVVQAATLQNISISRAITPVLNVTIGLFDCRLDMARLIHTISTDTGSTLLSASVALTRLCPLGLYAKGTSETATLLGRIPTWTLKIPMEVKDLLQTVALPANSILNAPMTWLYRAVMK